MSGRVIVTARDVIELFAGRSINAAAALRRWRGDPTKAEVVRLVEAHSAQVVHALSPADIESICGRTDHALGEVKRGVAESVSSVVDWHPDFAFSHLLHHLVEANGEVPTWQDLKRMRGRVDEVLWKPAREVRDQAVRAGHDQEHVRDAITWRIGNAYYSFLRELYVLSVLRESGLDARAHPLADALFRADLWIGGTVVSLYVGNPKFKSTSAGRKPRAQQLLDDAQPPFGFLDLELATKSKFGVVHLPDGREVVQRVRRRLG
jgi:hypothetical protein